MDQIKVEPKTELTKDELVTLVNVLTNTPTQNLQTAQALILLSNKISKMVDELPKSIATRSVR